MTSRFRGSRGITTNSLIEEITPNDNYNTINSFKWKLDFNSDYSWATNGKLYNTKTNKMKTQDKKTEQGYNPKPTISMCSNCKHYKSDFVVNEYNYKQEKNIRCGIGEFAVKKQGVCNLHQFQD